MATFVHVTAEDIARRIRRAGISSEKFENRNVNGVFAMPVTENFQVTHQWVRELKQWKRGMMVGVYFRIPDSELVWAGRYNEQHQQMTAAQASAQIRAQPTMNGAEVIIPRRIFVNEIFRIRRLPQLVGWRHYPDAHGKRPMTCDCCQKGGFNSRKIRGKFASTPGNSWSLSG